MGNKLEAVFPSAGAFQGVGRANGSWNSFLLLIYLFWLHWVFIALHRLSLVAASGSYSSLQCESFLLQWFLLLYSTGSRVHGL